MFDITRTQPYMSKIFDMEPRQMSFREKSAWVMSLALLLAGAAYFVVVAQMSAALGQIAPPLVPLIVVYVVALTLIAAFGHAIVAALAPKEAHAASDERDRLIVFRAGSFSGVVLGLGIVCAMGTYLVTMSGNALFHGVLASLMIAQLAEYLRQIVLYRTTV